MFSYKDKFQVKCPSGVIYDIQCVNCGPYMAYIRKTVNIIYQHFQMNTSTRQRRRVLYSIIACKTVASMLIFLTFAVMI